MRKHGKLTLIAILAAGITACTEDIPYEQENTYDGKNIITVEVPGPESRVEFDATGSNIQVKWKESGETFSLITNNPDFDNTKPEQGPDNFRHKNYTYTQVEGNKFAGNATLKAGNEVYAYYPCVGEYYNFLNGLHYNLSGQTGELNSEMTYMYIKDVNIDNVDVLKFKHLTALMKATFKVNGTNITPEIKSMFATMPDGLYSYNFVDLTTDPINYTLQRGYTNTISIMPQKKLDCLYIYLPFGIKKGDEIPFKIYDKDTYYTGNIKASMDIETGKIYPVDIELTSHGTYLWTPQTAATPAAEIKGTGISNDPYLIETANDLQWMIDNTSNSNGKHYKFMIELTIQTSETNPWIPIGSTTNPFNGTIDGNQKGISGTLVAGNGVDKFGFFGHIGTNGVVNNLWINTQVKGSTSAETYTGGVAGYNEGTISNSRSNRMVTGGNSTTGASYTGGVAGYNAGTIQNCVGSEGVKGESAKTIGYTGGVTGYNAGTITGGQAYGTISAAQAETQTIVGGIAGYNANGKTMNNCTNYANVTGAESPTNHIGGMAGINKGTIDNGTILSYANISSPTEGDINLCYLGGIAAENNGGNISYSINYAKITGGNAKSIYVGGLVAHNTNNSIIENTNCRNTVTGGTGETISCTAGVVALNDGTLSSCTIHKDVTGGSANVCYTGGLVGMNDTNGIMIDSYTQMGCIITEGTGTTNYTGIFAGNNVGKVYGCCYAGGNQSEADMDLIGNGNAVIVDDEHYSSCPLHSQQGN